MMSPQGNMPPTADDDHAHRWMCDPIDRFATVAQGLYGGAVCVRERAPQMIAKTSPP